MRILYVWDAEYPWDVRTEKVCLALAGGGHQVVITARNMKGRVRSEVLQEGLVERLPHWRGSRLLSFPAFFNPVWIMHIRRLVRQHAIDLIMVRDLPLAPTAILAAGKSRPVILDMAENYPAMIADIWADGRNRPLDRLVRNPHIVTAVERLTVRHVAHTLTVVEESSDRLVAMGVPADRVTVVSNTPSYARVGTPVPRLATDPLLIVYLGLMEKHRGIGDLLEAAHLLMTAGVEFHLDLVGDGRDQEYFLLEAARLGLTVGAVHFHGRLSHADAIRVVGRAHVGVVPHRATAAWNSTIPNKLFDYMAAGLAVVSSDAVPAARVTRETSAGLVFRSGDGRSLAEAIKRMLDVSFWDACRLAGQEAVRSHYNWECDSQVLLDAVSSVKSSHAPRIG